jgi:hypothetical protein
MGVMPASVVPELLLLLLLLFVCERNARTNNRNFSLVTSLFVCLRA